MWRGHKYFPMLRFGPGLAGLGISFECSFDAARITEQIRCIWVRTLFRRLVDFWTLVAFFLARRFFSQPGAASGSGWLVMRRTWINKKKIDLINVKWRRKERVNQCTWEEGDELTQIHNRVVGFCETPPILRNTDCLAALSHAWKKMGLSLKKPKMSWRPKKVKRNQLPLAPSASLLLFASSVIAR